LSQCNRCGSEITWKKPFTHGDRPLNMDNSVHSCKKDTPSPEPTPESKTPNTALEEVISFYETFKDVDAARFDSLCRVYNTLRMRK